MFRIAVKSLWPKMRSGGEIGKLSGPNYVRTRRPRDPCSLVGDNCRLVLVDEWFLAFGRASGKMRVTSDCFLTFLLQEGPTMPSPFPGMDPYIEACYLWDDFHHNLISGIQNALAPVLPKHYVVCAGERSYVALTTKNGVDEYPRASRCPASSGNLARDQRPCWRRRNADSTPITMRAMVRTDFREGFLEIREVHGDRQVVTAIEVLSPSNKRLGSEGWFEYLRKRQACLSGMVNFVEIDLLRRGRRMPMDDEWPDSPYCLLVGRKAEAPRCSVCAYPTRPLPEIPIPLAPPDADLPLSLQPLIDAIYARSHYEVDIDYRQPLQTEAYHTVSA